MDSRASELIALLKSDFDPTRDNADEEETQRAENGLLDVAGNGQLKRTLVYGWAPAKSKCTNAALTKVYHIDFQNFSEGLFRCINGDVLQMNRNYLWDHKWLVSKNITHTHLHRISISNLGRYGLAQNSWWPSGPCSSWTECRFSML